MNSSLPPAAVRVLEGSTDQAINFHWPYANRHNYVVHAKLYVIDGFVSLFLGGRGGIMGFIIPAVMHSHMQSYVSSHLSPVFRMAGLIKH